jgi:DNA-binding transcriptional ArsR family regulator
MARDLDPVWKALSDPSRRRILDLLRDGPRTTRDLSGSFDSSRFAVMKHLRVLERARLVSVRRRGRERWNYLNPIPIQTIYERWMTPYAAMWAGELLDLKRTVERRDEKRKARKDVASRETGTRV